MVLKEAAIAAVSLGGALLAVMYGEAKYARVRSHDAIIEAGRPGKGPSVFFISDIHRRRVTRALIRKAGGPFDAVIIGGDLAEGGVPEERIRHNVRRLAGLGPVYYVWGNNDRESGESTIRSAISSVGGKVLDNESVRLPGSGIRWMLVGTDDTSSYNVDIESAFSEIREEDGVIFVSHSPTVFGLLGEHDPQVRIAGHTHGGQIRLGRFGLLEKGSFETDNGKVRLVSNGYGTSMVPLRFGAPAECHILTLRAVEKRKQEM